METERNKNESPLMLGCMGFGGPWDAETYGTAEIVQAERAMGAALDAGILWFDHADIYARGRAEAAFGDALARSPALRDRIRIQTKCGIRPEGSRDWPLWPKAGATPVPRHDPGRYDFSGDWIVRAAEGCLRRLRTDHVDRLLLHRPDPLMEADEVAEAFLRLRKDGKVLGFGVSNFSAAQMAHLSRALAPAGLGIEANQMEISLLHHDIVEAGISVNQRGWAAAPWKGEFDGGSGSAAWPLAAGVADLMPYCLDHGVELQAWGCLAQGRLSGRPLAADAPPALRNAAAMVTRMAAELGEPGEAVVLAWLLRLPGKGRPLIRLVVGSTDPARITRAGRAATLRLSREEWYALYVAARGAPMP